jgi:hypothetical protein
MDVIIKEQCFVSINYQNVAVFNVSDPDTLNDFINLNFAKIPPQLVQGDPRCVVLESKVGYKLNFCVNNRPEAIQIIKAIKFLDNCKNRGKNKKKTNRCLELLYKLSKKPKFAEKNKKIFKKLKKLKKSRKSLFKK